MSPTRGSLVNILGRLGLSLAGLAVTALFGAMGVAIVCAPISGEPAWAGWFLRGFIALVFGALAAGGLYFAVHALLGERAPVIPAAVLERCPGCGELWTSADVCVRCELPRASCAGAWLENQSEGLGIFLFSGAFGGGMICLGLFAASYALFGDEKRLLLVIAYLGLAFLVTAVGGLCMFGLISMLSVRYVRNFSFRCAPDTRSITASARIDRGAITMEGSTERWRAIEEAGSESACVELLPPLRALAHIVAALHARGDAGLSFVECLRWSLRPGREPAALMHQTLFDVHVAVTPPRGVVHAVDARDLVLCAFSESSLAAVAASAVSASELASAVETYAARLSSVTVDPRALAALERVLCTVPPNGAAETSTLTLDAQGWPLV